MKILGWIILLLISSNAYSQGMLIEPPPLSVEDDGTRKIITRKQGEPVPVAKILDVIAPQPVEAVMTPNDDIINPPIAEQSVPVNPVDGQLKLDTETEKNVSIPTHNSVSEEVFIEYEQRSLRNYLQYSFGYIDSQYKKIHPSLTNGSMMTSFKFVADISTRYQLGLSVEVLTERKNEALIDSIRTLQYRLFFDYHVPINTFGKMKLDWVAGFGFSVGDYGIKKSYVNLAGQNTSVKIKDGMIVGFIPAIGVRFYLFDQNSFDLMFEYHQYFTKPQRYIGGMAIAPRFSFLF